MRLGDAPWRDAAPGVYVSPDVAIEALKLVLLPPLLTRDLSRRTGYCTLPTEGEEFKWLRTDAATAERASGWSCTP